jgi:hypothetical protein
MEIIKLNKGSHYSTNEKLAKKIDGYSLLLNELEKRNLPENIREAINIETGNVNAFSGSEKDFFKILFKSQSNILKLLEKELKLVVKNHYRNLWLPLGMSAFGIPLGVAFGLSIGNLAFLGLGLPIGMGMGVAVGTSLDNKAANEGRQLDVVFPV